MYFGTFVIINATKKLTPNTPNISNIYISFLKSFQYTYVITMNMELNDH